MVEAQPQERQKAPPSALEKAAFEAAAPEETRARPERLAAFARPLLGLRPVQLLELPLALPLESLPELRLVQPPKLRLEQNRRRMPAEKEVSQAAAERVSPALVIRLPQETPAREQAGQAKSANRAQA